MLDTAYLNELIRITELVIAYADSEMFALQQKADSTFVRKYGTDSIGLGMLYPSIRMKYSSGKYGRWVNDVEGMSDYTVYEFDGSLDPLRIKHIRNNICTEEIFFFEFEGEKFAVPYVLVMNRYYDIGEMYHFKYDEGRLTEFAYVTRFRVLLDDYDNSAYPHVKVEKIDYSCQKGADTESKTMLYEYDIEDGNIANVTVKS